MRYRRERLRQVRRGAGLTQEELAHRLGVDRTTVVRWESGATEPSAWLLPKLARLLGVSRAELMSVLDSPARPVNNDVLHDDERIHLQAALHAPGRVVDETTVGYFRRELDACTRADGKDGARPTLPRVLGILSAMDTCARDVPMSELPGLLSVAARGAEFAGWLCRDAHDTARAAAWYSRATELAQEANDPAMQGYVLLKKSQMAYDERDARRVLTLARAAQYGPWPLSRYVRAEVTQQEARGLAMTGAALSTVKRKLDEAHEIFAGATDDDVHTQLGCPYDENTLALRDASCYVEAGRPQAAVTLYRTVLSGGTLSQRDRGYYTARLASSLALSGEPDEAAAVGLDATRLGAQTRSRRTHRELVRAVAALRSWDNRPAPRAFREMLGTVPG